MRFAVIELLEKELKGKLKKCEIENLVEVSPQDEFGDYAFPCFSLAKIEKKSPLAIAESLCEKLRRNLPKEISSVDVKSCYVNFFVDKNLLAEKVLKGDFKIKQKRENVIVDYSHPNVAKYFGVHNLRSTLIGLSLYKILKVAGRDVWSINHLGDWGTQFGKLIVAYNNFKKPIVSIKDLNNLYVKFHNDAEKDEGLNQLAKEEFKKLEDGDKENLKLWKKFYGISLKEFNRVYNILGIKFDETRGESCFRDISKVKAELQKRKLLEMSDGANVVWVSGDNPPLIFEKSDEASTYGSRDLAAIFSRLEKKPDKILYVVDVAQSLHFKQVFEVAKKLEVKADLIHVKFGRLSFKDKKMSTRKGQVILFEELLNRAEKKSLEMINQKNSNLKNKKIVARKVALAGIVFNDLKQDRKLNIVFDWDEALRAEGRTGPYLLYTYARASSIARKVKSKKVVKIIDLKKQEIALLKKLSVFGEVVARAGDNFAPHILAEYCYELAKSFNEFYHSCPVLGNVEEGFRLKLLKVFMNVMKKGLGLLGIDVVEEM